MEHIELLTIKSYLKVKSDVLRNIDYVPEKLDIADDSGIEEIMEIFEKIKEEYFQEKDEDIISIALRKQGGDFEIGISRSMIYEGKNFFLESLKDKYKDLIGKGEEQVIVSEIETMLHSIFKYGIRQWAVIESKMYEIIKYTLTEEKRCDYFDNGKFITEMKEDDIYPFDRKNDTLPIFCQELQRILFGIHRKIFERNDQSLDITRFGFYNTRKIIEAVTKKLKEIEKERNIEDQEVRKVCDSRYYTEGIEDYILLDKILGISLTNIIYWKTKEKKEREVQDLVITITKHLAKCQYSVGRNLVAQVLLDYLAATDYNKRIMEKVEKSLEKAVKVWNEFYEEVEAALLVPIFNYLKNCPISDYEELCESIEDESSWGNYIYMDEIADEEGGEEDKNWTAENIKIRIPKGNMDRKTWYAYIHQTVFNAIWTE